MRRTATLVTYNLLHGLHLGGGGALDLEAAARTIADLDADVVALQEVDRELPRTGGVDQVAVLAKALGWSAVFAPALLGSPDGSWVALDREDPGGPAYGVAILSRMPIRDWHRRRLPGGGDGRRRRAGAPSRPGWDREPRTALAAAVETPVGQVSVITTHLSYLPWRGLRQLRAAARLSPDDGPCALLGDLNLPPGALKGTLPSWQHHVAPPTYPAWEPRMRIDHVLTRELHVSGLRTWPYGTSDHTPLLADVAVPG